MTLWGGRFTTDMNDRMSQLNDSISFDRRMYAADVDGSIAYAAALERAGLLSVEERDGLVAGLEKVREEFDRDTFTIKAGDEDIHTAVERRLGEIVGSVAGKLHTGRSRNDQVTTDLRIHLRGEIAKLSDQVVAVQAAIIDSAEAHQDTIMPGYTHMQPAQPVLFSHWLMSYFWKFQRDRARLEDALRRIMICPLGAGALAGNPFDIDRQALAADLGFRAVAENSVDAVGDRDYVVELLAWAALLQTHLGSLAEDLIVWSSREFGFVDIDEAYSTGSSLMPQKKNPDSLELIRGKSGRIIGRLIGTLTMLKGLPSAYNKDMQEDKEAVFEVIDTLNVELPVAAAVIRTLKVNESRMSSALDESILATDLADYLVRKGVPFRESHHLVGRAVQEAENTGVPLSDLGLAEFRAIDPAFDGDLYQVFDCRRSVEARKTEGGTAPAMVRAQIKKARVLLTKPSQA